MKITLTQSLENFLESLVGKSVKLRGWKRWRQVASWKDVSTHTVSNVSDIMFILTFGDRSKIVVTLTTIIEIRDE